MILELSAQETRSGLESTQQQLRDWRERWPDCSVLALLPETGGALVAPLQQLCADLGLPVYGALFPELVHADGLRKDGLVLICLAPQVRAALAGGDARLDYVQLHQTYAALSADNPPRRDNGATLFTIFDAMVPDIGSILGSFHAGLVRVPRFLGVNAGSESFQPMPCLFDGTRLIQGGVLCVYFPGELHSALQHAYLRSVNQWRATSSSGNRIITIDDRPAFEVYQSIVRREFAVELRRDNFYDYAVHFPFGLVTALDILVRIPVGLGDDGSIRCVGEIPPNSLLRVLRAPSLAESNCLRALRATLEGRAATRPAPDTALLTFYCAGRRMHFGAESLTELGQLAAMGYGTPLGALSLGEIDTLDDLAYPRFHNAAIVCITP